MENSSHTDSFGTLLFIGDYVVFASSYNKGSTALQKAQVVSFTKKGNPRIMKMCYDYQSYKNGGPHWVAKEFALTGSYAKAIDKIGEIKLT